jgi:signal transduction histidine kinase
MELVSGVKLLTAAAEGTAEEWERTRQNSLIALFRSQRGIGTSVDSIANRFEEFLVEVKNNRLDEEMQAIDPARTIESRFSNEIIEPIRVLDAEWIANACRNLDNCRKNLNDPGVFASSVAQTLKIQEEILERMRQILASMEDSENFQEVVNKLLEIKRIEERMKQELKGVDNPERVFDKNKGIFDDDK